MLKLNLTLWQKLDWERPCNSNYCNQMLKSCTLRTIVIACLCARAHWYLTASWPLSFLVVSAVSGYRPLLRSPPTGEEDRTVLCHTQHHRGLEYALLSLMLHSCIAANFKYTADTVYCTVLFLLTPAPILHPGINCLAVYGWMTVNLNSKLKLRPQQYSQVWRVKYVCTRKSCILKNPVCKVKNSRLLSVDDADDGHYCPKIQCTKEMELEKDELKCRLWW